MPMFATIIVPLDGSADAEVALPYAIDETGRHGARLLLVRVLWRPELAIANRNHGGPVPLIPTWPPRELAIAEHHSVAYLRDVCRRFDLGIDTRLVVAVGDPGLRLLAEARMHPRPLVVLATGGGADPRSPLSGLARRLLTSDGVPVLAVRQPTPAHETPVLASPLPDPYFRHVVPLHPMPPLVVPLPSHDGPSLVPEWGQPDVGQLLGSPVVAVPVGRALRAVEVGGDGS
jgi:nucleotide-binding universal stress UspA family protein